MHIHPIHLNNFFHNRELDEMYISVAIRSFAMSLVSVFVPIYLYTLNFSLSQILFFFIIYHTTHALFVIPSAHIAAKWGFKHAIALSLPLLIVFYLLLYSVEGQNWIWVPAAIIGGIYSAVFWMGYHLDFTEAGDSKSFGKQIGTARILSSLFYAIGPVVGGVILTFLGFSTLFAIASILILASMIPLFFSKDFHKEVTFTFKDVFRGRRLGDFLAFIGHGVANGVELVIWPIFIFVTFFNENFSTLGSLVSVSFIASLLITYIAGKRADKKGKQTMAIGSIGTAILWFLRIFIWLPIHVFVIDFIYGGLKAFLFIAFDAKSYKNAKDGDLISYTVFREISLNIARILGFAIFILLSDYVLTFAGASLTSLLYIFF